MSNHKFILSVENGKSQEDTLRLLVRFVNDGVNSHQSAFDNVGVVQIAPMFPVDSQLLGSRLMAMYRGAHRLSEQSDLFEVAREFAGAVNVLREEATASGKDGAWLNTHPISRVFAQRLADLAFEGGDASAHHLAQRWLMQKLGFVVCTECGSWTDDLEGHVNIQHDGEEDIRLWRPDTFLNEDAAFEVVGYRNKMVAGPNNGKSARSTLWVVVDGPEDEMWSVMTVEDAIEEDFKYRWIA